MKKRLTALVLAMAVVTVSCGGSAGVDRGDSADVIAEELGTDIDVGRCIVDTTIEAIGEDRLAAIENGDLPTELELAAVIEARATCEG